MKDNLITREHVLRVVVLVLLLFLVLAGGVVFAGGDGDGGDGDGDSPSCQADVTVDVSSASVAGCDTSDADSASVDTSDAGGEGFSGGSTGGNIVGSGPSSVSIVRQCSGASVTATITLNPPQWFNCDRAQGSFAGQGFNTGCGGSSFVSGLVSNTSYNYNVTWYESRESEPITASANGSFTTPTCVLPQPPPQCNNSINDNDDDTLVDENDPGCYSGSGGTYNPNDDDETNPPPAVNLDLNPTIVRKGGSAQITWSASNVFSCTVTGPGVDVIKTAPRVGGSLNGPPPVSTGAINEESTYTLSCKATDGSTPKRVKTVYPIPTIIEF